MGMAGFTAAQQIEALPGVLNLAAAGSLELGAAADIAQLPWGDVFGKKEPTGSTGPIVGGYGRP